MPWLPRRRARADAALVEERAYSIADPALAMLLGYSPTDAPAVSEQTALTLSAVYRAVSLIAGTMAQLPLRTLTLSADGTQKRAVSFLDSPGLDRWSPHEWKQLVMVYLLLHGAAPLQHIFNGAGQVIGLAPIHPCAVSVEEDLTRPGGRLFKARQLDGTSREFDSRTLTYVMGLSLDGVRGVSPITMARMSMGTALSGDKAANRMFSSGASISGLVTPKDDDLTAEDAKVIKSMVNRTMTGPENAGDIAVATRALEFKPWAMSATDAQFVQSRAFSVEEVGRWFGIPPHLLGQTEKSTSWGTGIEEQNRGLHRYTLSPWSSCVQDRLTPLVPEGMSVEFDYAGFLQPSPEEEIRLLLEQVNGGTLTPNESRRIRNMPPVAGAINDKLRIPAGMSDGLAPAGANNGGPA